MSVKLIGRVFNTDFDSPIEKGVMLALAYFASDDGGNIYPTVATIASYAGLSERSVQRSIKKLITDKYLALDGTRPSLKGPINVYRMLIGRLATGDTQSPVTDSHPTDDTLRGDTQSPRGDTQSPRGDTQSPRGDTQSPNPLENRQRTSTPEREPADAGAPPPDTHPSGEVSLSDHPAVKLWLELLKPKMKNATPHFKTVADHIGSSPESLRCWQDALNFWMENDHNPTNAEGLLSRFDKFVRKAGQGRPASKSGNGRQSKSGTFRREQVPPRNGLQSEIDACLRNAKNARDRGDVAKAEKWEAAAEKLTAQLAQP